MRKALKWRYYCDFCSRKASGSKHVMVKHERGCTMNPDRVCGVCKMVDATQKPIGELISALNSEGEYKALRIAANECPACILAALRQRNKGLRYEDCIDAEGFDFKAEMKDIWANINDAKEQREYAHY